MNGDGRALTGEKKSQSTLLNAEQKDGSASSLQVSKNGSTRLFDLERIRRTLTFACEGFDNEVSIDTILEEVGRNIFNGVSASDLSDALVLAAVSFIERDPAYSRVAARLMCKKLFKEVTGVGTSTKNSDHDTLYRDAFYQSIAIGVEKNIFDARMGNFELDQLAKALCLERDELFEYMGIRTLYERYFVKDETHRLELPQIFWMRVAMGLAIEEKNPTARAIEFYHLMSSMHYIPGTPTLLHAGLTRSQLSSCFLGTVGDDLGNIFKSLGDNAQLSKWSGGVAYDWTNIRATGSMIKSINTESQGLIPFLKIANDVTASINRSGKRRGAACVYLETWHLDIEDFLDLRRNTGDERRRAHDINTANWVPDLFIKRVINDEQWMLFSPEEVSDLHHLFGKAFEDRYHYYEQQAQEGKIKKFKVMEATKLWRKMLSRLFETGHPWITFKDACNVRSPQDHTGVIHCSNLCTEITLNTSADETAVCNLGSINLAKHINNKKLDVELLRRTINTAVRMLDNVIDINFYPIKEAQTANERHRPIGLGVMGFQDALYQTEIAFTSPQALTFADQAQEQVAYCAILASSELAKERGRYQSYEGSKWDRGLFPQDTVDLLEQERGVTIETKRGGVLDWTPVRNHVRQHGMRNSNMMAIAPTATISNIAGSFPCIEPIYKNLYVKANMSGEFTIVNRYLVDDLKQLGLWNDIMLEKLKYFDGSVQLIEELPDSLRHKYKEAFEIDPEWLIKITAARGKWIDQSQSHNVFMKGVSGKKLHEIYVAAWRAGLKTTYYLRTLGATQIEKSTLDAKKYGFTQKREYQAPDSTQVVKNGTPTSAEPDLSNVSRTCTISEDPECDVCQ